MTRITVAQERQRGMVLVVSLVILGTLTVLGLAAYQNTTLEERMAGNFRSLAVARQSAEAGAQFGERWLACRKFLPDGVSGTTPPDPTAGSNDNAYATRPGQVYRADLGVDLLADVDIPWWADPNATPGWWQATSAIGYPSGDSPQNPRYVVESLGTAASNPVGSLTYKTEQYGRLGGGWAKESQYYQVTSEGVDIGGRSRVLLRSTYQCRKG